MKDLLPTSAQLPGQNLSDQRRIISTTVGITLLTLALLDGKRSIGRRVLRAGIGAVLLYRGVSGYCPVTNALQETPTDIYIVEG